MKTINHGFPSAASLCSAATKRKQALIRLECWTQTNLHSERTNAVQSFIQRFGDKVSGVLSGWDRVRFRGTLRWLASRRGLESFLATRRILLKDFKDWALGLTDRIREATEALAHSEGLKVRYVTSSLLRKEEIAQIEAGTRWSRDGISCILSCVEPCRSFTVRPNGQTKKLELRYQDMKCLHYYVYLRHPQVGPMHVRLQTWLPFNVFVCLNGRDWLGRQLTQARMPHVQCDNTFRFVKDVGRAQQLLSGQLRTDWNRLLDRLVRRVHPAHRRLFEATLDYYWSAEATEWATDVMFRSADDLAALYPRLVRHGMLCFGGDDVLRFLGRPGTVRQLWRGGQLQSDLKKRHEGLRLKHALNHNSLKMYDKQASVLRVETTLNDPRDLKVYRTVEGDPQGPKRWLRLRKGVADLQRRAKVSQAANARYLEALAAVDDTSTLEQLAQPLCHPVSWNGGRARALNPLSEQDAGLLTAVNRGEFAINGFRNRDLAALLSGDPPTDPLQAKRRSAKVTRQLRLLRAHGLIRKVPHTHRYLLTNAGRTTINALLAAKHATTEQLTRLAI